MSEREREKEGKIYVETVLQDDVFLKYRIIISKTKTRMQNVNIQYKTINQRL